MIFQTNEFQMLAIMLAILHMKFTCENIRRESFILMIIFISLSVKPG